MTHLTAFDQAFEQCPLVAILRGVKPDEVEEIGEVLVDRGIGLIEVPLNSPQPFESIARLARRFSDRAVVGAGTVLTEADVARVRDAGGQLIVSPNTDAVSASVSGVDDSSSPCSAARTWCTPWPSSCASVITSRGLPR